MGSGCPAIWALSWWRGCGRAFFKPAAFHQIALRLGRVGEQDHLLLIVDDDHPPVMRRHLDLERIGIERAAELLADLAQVEFEPPHPIDADDRGPAGDSDTRLGLDQLGIDIALLAVAEGDAAEIAEALFGGTFSGSCRAIRSTE